jgi:hypothetical protein
MRTLNKEKSNQYENHDSCACRGPRHYGGIHAAESEMKMGT